MNSPSSSRLFTFRRWLNSKRIHAPSQSTRVFLVLIALFVSFLLSGVFMGINALQSVWSHQGRYEHLCNGVDHSKEPPILILPDAKCSAQASKLLLLSHVASGFTYAMIPMTGFLTDWQGARRVFGGVIALLVLGNAIAVIPTYWTQFIGTVIMSGMGPCLAFNMLVWAQLAPGWTNWVVSIIAASFPAGSYILGLLRLAVLKGPFNISTFYLLWLLCFSIPALYLFIIWPRGLGKPYAQSHPLRMLAYFNFAKQLMIKWGIKLPEDADHTTQVELEEKYAAPTDTAADNQTKTEQDESNDQVQIQLDFDSDKPATKSESNVNINETTANGNGDAERPVDLEAENKVALDLSDKSLRAVQWMDQLNSVDIILLQGYFLIICVWLTLVANLGAYRLTYWAKKTSTTPEQLTASLEQAKTFLPNLDLINMVSIIVAPIAAMIMKSAKPPALAFLIHITATISALLCLSSHFQVQILNFVLFPVVRGLLYPFAIMFLIQTCGRRHLGLLWALTISGGGPTDFIRTILMKFWLHKPNAWDVLNGVQLILIIVSWVWPIFVWIKREHWEEIHAEPLN